MLEENLIFIKKHLTIALVWAAFVVFILLRFINLGYSEYIPDETTVMSPIKNSQLSIDFLLNQRKGPMQFLIAYIPKILGVSVFDEFSNRLFFFAANVLGLVFFYKFVTKIEGRFVGLVAVLFLGLNGLIIAFGRIVQYQNLNILFSSMSLFYVSKLHEKKHVYSNAFLAGLSLSLSALSHWDVVFVAPVVILLFAKNILLNKDLKKGKILSLVSFLAPVIALVPLILVYSKTGLSDPSNISYFYTRVNTNSLSGERIIGKLADYVEKIEIYNPFLYIYFLGFLSFVGIIGNKKSYPFFYWFLSMLTVFLIVVARHGTHVYNLIYPLSILAALGAEYLYKILPKGLSSAVVFITVLFFGFFAYQDYMIFNDTKVDYPWSQEKILGYKTREFTQQSLPNNVLGFPIKRGWKDVSAFVEDNKKINGNNMTYVTNEESSISEFYVDLPYGKSDSYYAFGVKRPLSFVVDYTFPEIKKKATIKKIEVDGENTIRIYGIYTDK